MTASRNRVFGLIAVALFVILAFVLADRDKPANDTDVEAGAPVATEDQPTETATALPRDFPEVELASALAAACSGAGPNSADTAGKEWTQGDVQAQIEAFHALKQSLSERLSVSPSAEHLHLAALLEDDTPSRMELLDRALRLSPSDPFLAWGAVQICAESSGSGHCPLRDWEQRLIAVDGQNSEAWIRVAANRYAAGEHDAALEAMRYASTAAESRAYWTETVEMIERGFAAGSDYAFAERAGMAFGFAASELPRYGDYVLQARRQERLDSLKDRSPATERLIFSNPTLFFAYLAAIRSEGETAARRRISAEIERLVAQRSDLGCGQVE